MKLARLAKDILKAFLGGVLFAVLLGIVLFGLGFLFGGNLRDAWNTIRSGLLIVTAALMFVYAGLLLFPKKEGKIVDTAHRWFEGLGLRGIVGFQSLGFLAIAVAVDYIVWYL